jgi:hypothetical protein
MKQDWHSDELAQYWTFLCEKCALLGNKAGATRLGFALLLEWYAGLARKMEHDLGDNISSSSMLKMNRLLLRG